MAYEPKEWVCGETITAEALNHIENGIEECCSGGSIDFSFTVEDIPPSETCEYGGTKYTYSHSWQELCNAIQQGKMILVFAHEFDDVDEYYTLSRIYSVGITHGEYCAYLDSSSEPLRFSAAESKGYTEGCDR